MLANVSAVQGSGREGLSSAGRFDGHGNDAVQACLDGLQISRAERHAALQALELGRNIAAAFLYARQWPAHGRILDRMRRQGPSA